MAAKPVAIPLLVSPDAGIEPLPDAAQEAEPEFRAARTALTAHRLDAAESAFRRLIMRFPELSGPQANLGLVLERKGDAVSAEAAYRLALEKSPRNPRIYNQLGVMLRRAGRFDDARVAYESALDVDPGYAAAHLNLGILMDLYLRRPAEALPYYERYLSLDATDEKTIRKWLADLKLRLKTPATAGNETP